MIPRRIRFWYESAGRDKFPTGKKAYSLCVSESSLQQNTESEVVRCISGRDAKATKLVSGTSIQGSLTSAGFYETQGFFFRAFMGDAVNVTANGNKFTHEFHTGGCPRYFGVEHLFDHKNCESATTEYLINRYTGLKITDMSTTVSGKGLPEIQWSVVGSRMLDNHNSVNDPDTGAPVIPVTDLLDATGATEVAGQGLTDFIPESTVLNSCHTWIEIDGVRFEKIGQVQLNLKSVVNTTDLLGCGKDNTVAATEVTGSLSGVWDKDLYEKLAVPNQKIKMVVGFTDQDPLETDTKSELKYTFEEIALSFNSTPMKYGESMVLQADFTATKKDPTTPTMKVELTTTVAQYDD